MLRPFFDIFMEFGEEVEVNTFVQFPTQLVKLYHYIPSELHET